MTIIMCEGYVRSAGLVHLYTLSASFNSLREVKSRSKLRPLHPELFVSLQRSSSAEAGQTASNCLTRHISPPPSPQNGLLFHWEKRMTGLRAVSHSPPYIDCQPLTTATPPLPSKVFAWRATFLHSLVVPVF